MPEAKLNLSLELKEVIRLLIQRLPVFSHIRTEQLAVFLATARKNSKYGVYAKVMAANEVPGGYELTHFPAEKLYAIYFYWPRFFNVDFKQKLNVICHELFHISAEFDGKLRRFGTRLHGASREKFEQGYNQQLFQMIESCSDDFSSFTSLHFDARALSKRMKLEGDFYKLPKLKRL